MKRLKTYEKCIEVCKKCDKRSTSNYSDDYNSFNCIVISREKKEKMNDRECVDNWKTNFFHDEEMYRYGGRGGYYCQKWCSEDHIPEELFEI